MTPGDAYWVGVARPRKPAHTPLVVVSHRTIVNNNLPVSYLCTQPERWVTVAARRRFRGDGVSSYSTGKPSRRWRRGGRGSTPPARRRGGGSIVGASSDPP